jgi:hypothetical protein
VIVCQGDLGTENPAKWGLMMMMLMDGGFHGRRLMRPLTRWVDMSHLSEFVKGGDFVTGQRGGFAYSIHGENKKTRVALAWV